MEIFWFLLYGHESLSTNGNFHRSVIIVFHTILERLVNSSENHDHKNFLDSFKYNDQATVFAEEPKMIFPH